MDIQARRRGRRTYYYLVQSYREGTRVRKVERYLGPRRPDSTAKLREDFGQHVISQQSGPALERLRAEYASELGRTPPSLREKELETFAVQFTYDSNRIEGSSLTLRETASLLERGITPGNRPLSDVRESLAHRTVFLAALSDPKNLDLSTFLRWHRELFKETKPELAGLVRRTQVLISGSKFRPPGPVELDLLLTEFFGWLPRAWRSVHPVVLAALVHLRLVTIHPFGDGNGRVTRIAMNFVLHRKGFPMLDIPYKRRAGYDRALERAQTKSDEFIFVGWFVRRYLSENTGRFPARSGRGRNKRSGSPTR